MCGFCARLESDLQIASFEGALNDYEQRRKLSLLATDLKALGLDEDSVRALPLCVSLRTCSTAAQAFGTTYVLEGATLGGRILAPLLQRRLGLTVQQGGRYISSYEGHVDRMWQTFVDALNQCCDTAARQAEAAEAAVATFETLGLWLCPQRWSAP